ncbi:hypothetical protein [Billgrantia endophytica]|nr:hypothetical protein [Halomonas endophytica]
MQRLLLAFLITLLCGVQLSTASAVGEGAHELVKAPSGISQDAIPLSSPLFDADADDAELMRLPTTWVAQTTSIVPAAPAFVRRHAEQPPVRAPPHRL